MPSHPDGSLIDDLSIAAAAMTELAAMRSDRLVDLILDRLRSRGMVLYDHDVTVISEAVHESFELMLGSVALAIQAR